MASLLSFTSHFYKNDSYAEFLEVNDTELFGVGVRIYKPVNKTKKHTGNESNKQDLLPGLIYFHGGAWTWGSLGESYFFSCTWRISHGCAEIQNSSSSVEKFFTSGCSERVIYFFQHEKRNFVSPSDHVTFYLLYKHQ